MYPQLVVVALLVFIIPNFFFPSSFYSVFVFCFHKSSWLGRTHNSTLVSLWQICCDDDDHHHCLGETKSI